MAAYQTFYFLCKQAPKVLRHHLFFLLPATPFGRAEILR